MKRSPKIIGLSLAAVVTVAGYYFYAGRATPAGQRPLERLDASNFTDLRSAFNEAKDSVRIVTLLSPT